MHAFLEAAVRWGPTVAPRRDFRSPIFSPLVIILVFRCLFILSRLSQDTKVTFRILR